VEAEQEDLTLKEVWRQMKTSWIVMSQAIQHGLTNENKSVSGLTGGDAKRLHESKPVYLGSELSKAVAMALGVAEVNACMGKIVACPTAGSCGIIPAALTFAQRKYGFSDDEIISSLFTAAGIGIVCSVNASISGAEGGCQAECGVASAMAAGALVELSGGNPEMVGESVAISLINQMGLVCDPVAGLVEVPCIQRNAGSLMQGILAAEQALAGIQSIIPVDEVIEAMQEVGEALPESLKETGEGGLATTPTGRKIADRLR
jgi:L-serine dehydratase